ncbi:MAG: ABC transporter permease [Clostridiales Family XIII bacterium]|jgi:ABC-2 type transport system permease protein|nr:ABC transporter permease [Clostridiales Family XIII bacterium]
MASIINSDYFKLRKNIALWLLPAASLVATVVTACFMMFVDSGAATVEGGEAVSSMDVFGFDPAGAFGAHAMFSITNLYAILAVVFSGLFISNEYASGTIAGALCIGKSRVQVYLSKLLTSSTMMLLVTLVSVLAFIGSFTVLYGFGDGSHFPGETLKIFGLQFLYHLCYAALACMLAFLIQNIVFSVSVGIFAVIISGVLTDILTAFDGFEVFAHALPNYYITRLSEHLNDPAFITQSVIASAVFIAVTTVIGSLAFSRKDIK